MPAEHCGAKECACTTIDLQFCRFVLVQVEEICAKECPLLSKRIVVISERTIMRQAPKTDMFLL